MIRIEFSWVGRVILQILSKISFTLLVILLHITLLVHNATKIVNIVLEGRLRTAQNAQKTKHCMKEGTHEDLQVGTFVHVR